MRAVKEWVGKDDDAVPPPRVRLRVFDRYEGRCGQCWRNINAGEKWTLEHMVAIINGGENRERNLGVTCAWCLRVKNATDVAEKSAVAKSRKKHLGIRSTSRPMDGSKNSPWYKPFRGPAVRRSP